MVITMSRVIVKVNYHNPKSATKSISGYAKYIAKREGVEIRNQDKDRPLEITYADYIATRPGVETRGSHGLFSIEDRPISLSKVSEDLNAYKGNVWTVIVSLRKDDAVKTGYDSSEAWRELIASRANDIAKNFNIPVNELNCYAAFHKSDEHPHIHMIVWSKNQMSYPGYHKSSNLQALKSIFTREIFDEELSEIYQSKGLYRDELRTSASERIRQLVEDIKNDKTVSPTFVSKFIELSERLSTIEGKKVYGYLTSDVKDMVDDLLREISSEPLFTELYDKWYELKEQQDAFYSSKVRERIPIEKNDEFKSIKNAIVREASRMKLSNSSSENIVAAECALDDLLDMLSQIYAHSADEHDLNYQEVIEEQSEVDEALGIKHNKNKQTL